MTTQIPNKHKCAFEPLTKETLSALGQTDLIDLVLALDKEVSELKAFRLLVQWGRFKSSKDINPNQLNLFNEVEAIAVPDVPETSLGTAIKAHVRKAKTKDLVNRIDLDVEEATHDIDDKACPACGTKMYEMKREHTDTLQFIPARFIIRRDIYPVYSCRHCQKAQMTKPDIKVPFVKSGFVAKPIPKSFASASLVATVINAKYTNALPLERISQEFGRWDVDISRQDMSNWVIKATELYFKPIYDRQKTLLKTLDVLHADETSVKVVEHHASKTAGKNKDPGTGWLWLYRSGVHDKPNVIFEYHPTRKHQVAIDFFVGWSGYLHTDGYDGYNKLGDDVCRIACLVHIKRKFSNNLKAMPKGVDKTLARSAEAIRLIGEIFAADRQYKDMSPDERCLARNSDDPMSLRSRLDAFNGWLLQERDDAVPETGLGNAVNYAISQMPYMMNVLKDGRLVLSNNLAEQSIRPVAVGRKNWVCARNELGAHTSAVLYSITRTALENKLKPYEYFKWLLEVMPNCKDIAASIDAFLPWSDSIPDYCRMPDKADEADTAQ